MASVFLGCAAEIDPITKLYLEGDMLQKGENMVEVKQKLVLDPDTKQKINNAVIWTFEHTTMNEDTEEQRYNTLSVRFVDGKIEDVASYSYKLPKLEEE